MASATLSHPGRAREPFSGLRAVITIPPAHFFGGVDRWRALDTASALRRLGATVYEFETGPGYRGDAAAVEAQISVVRTFRPDFAVAASQAGYAIEACTIETSGSDRRNQTNIFLDLLGLPLICYWDQIIPQLPRYVLDDWRSRPNRSAAGALSRMREAIRHPSTYHFIPDTGHIARLTELGVADDTIGTAMVTNVPDMYLSAGTSHAGAAPVDRSLAFFGNVYLAAEDNLRRQTEPELWRVSETAIALAASDWTISPYDAFAAAIAGLSARDRSHASLDPDQTFYWRFMFDQLSVVANGRLRQQKLAAGGSPICSHGGFADPATSTLLEQAGWDVRDAATYGPTLAQRYASAGICVDVANAPFINGFSPKILECFAAGGFMLSSRQSDLTAAFGELGEAISFSSADELCSKVDRFMGNDRERIAVRREIRDIIAREHTATALLLRTIPPALEAIRARR